MMGCLGYAVVLSFLCCLLFDVASVSLSEDNPAFIYNIGVAICWYYNCFMQVVGYVGWSLLSYVFMVWLLCRNICWDISEVVTMDWVTGVFLIECPVLMWVVNIFSQKIEQLFCHIKHLLYLCHDFYTISVSDRLIWLIFNNKQ